MRHQYGSQWIWRAWGTILALVVTHTPTAAENRGAVVVESFVGDPATVMFVTKESGEVQSIPRGQLKVPFAAYIYEDPRFGRLVCMGVEDGVQKCFKEIDVKLSTAGFPQLEKAIYQESGNQGNAPVGNGQVPVK